MEKRNYFVLRALDHAEFREDQPGLIPPSGPSIVSGSAGSVEANVADWKIISQAPGHVGEVIDYNENVLYCRQPSGHVPIVKDGEHACLFAMDLPSTADTRRVALKVEDTATGYIDEVAMLKIPGSYEQLKEAAGRNILFSGPNFFTIRPVPGQPFETYLDIGVANQVVKLTYSIEDTFDQVRFSFLLRMP